MSELGSAAITIKTSLTDDDSIATFDSHEAKPRLNKKQVWSNIIDNPTIVLRILIVMISIIQLLAAQEGFTVTDGDAANTQNGYVITDKDEPPRPIVANNTIEMILLIIARASAFLMYIDLVLVFFMKCRALMNLLCQTPLTNFLPDDLHDQHTRCGLWIFWCALIHAITHCVRWIIAGNFNLLVQSTSGLTGNVRIG